MTVVPFILLLTKLLQHTQVTPPLHLLVQTTTVNHPNSHIGTNTDGDTIHTGTDEGDGNGSTDADKSVATAHGGMGSREEEPPPTHLYESGQRELRRRVFSCPTCGDPADGSHQCGVCFVHIHTICSAAFPGSEEGHGNHAYAWSAHHLQLTKQRKVVLPIEIHLPFLAKVMATVQLMRSHLPHIYIKADKENYGAVCFRVRHAEIPPMGPINAASTLFISIPSVVSPFQGRRRVMGNHGYAWSAHHLQLLTNQRKVVLPIWIHLPFLAKVMATVQMKI
jgi:hypothetical protein